MKSILLGLMLLVPAQVPPSAGYPATVILAGRVSAISNKALYDSAYRATPRAQTDLGAITNASQATRADAEERLSQALEAFCRKDAVYFKHIMTETYKLKLDSKTCILP